MVVETVEKRPGAKSLRRFRGDASKVNVRGPGLKKARCNQTQTFTIDVKDAGKYYQIFTGKMQKSTHSWNKETETEHRRVFFYKYIVFLNICTMVLLRSMKIKFECVRVILNNPSSNLRDDSYSQETRKKNPNKQQQSWRKRLKEIQFCLSGHAMLCVGMVAPNGLPEPELMVKKNNPTQYTVSYKVVEAGEHTLCIRFGDEEVPGSPFSIAT